MSTAKPVMQVLATTDDHLQQLQHYAHSHDLRNAMSTVGKMLDALVVAREFISTDRNSLADCSRNSDGSMHADDAACVADYDAALLQIDAAIATATATGAAS